jgi:hypothetical protein
VPVTPHGVSHGPGREWDRKRQRDFEHDRALTPTQRFELGLRLNERAREMRGIYLRSVERAD